MPLRILWEPGRGHWLLARRSITDPTDIAYYVCYGPRRSTLLDLARIAGARRRIEECFQQAKNEAGLDHCQARSWRAWYAHITLSMLAHAWLAVTRSLVAKGGTSAGRTNMIGFTLPGIRRLLIGLVLRPATSAEHVWSWSCWRRRRQHDQDRLSHYKRRGHPLT
ncbi:hypothetical protein GCM10027184_10860 [Saccharothrix stipae]